MEPPFQPVQIRMTLLNRQAPFFQHRRTFLRRYLKGNKKKYELTSGIFLEKSLHRWRTYFSMETVRSLTQVRKLNFQRHLNAVNEGFFTSPHLVQLFNRYATYNGSSPYKTPGIMSMIPHLEMYFGTFYPEGGMHSISQRLYQLALQQGITFNFNHHGGRDHAP